MTASASLLYAPAWLPFSKANAADAAPLVAAASDAKFALDAVAALFHDGSGKTVRLVYGSSGNLRRQIAGGAPFELFFSADEAYVDALASESLTVGAGVIYGIGRISIFVPASSPLKPDGELKDLVAAVRANQIRRFAIANPEHAPYGRAAREVLNKAGIWSALQPRLAIGENIAQATQFASGGSTDGGIVAHSLALVPAISKLGRSALIPEQWHAPLRQKMVLLKAAGDTARSFHAFVQTPAARALLRQHGFALPSQ